MRAAGTNALSISNNWFVAVDSLLVVRDSTKYELVKNTVSERGSAKIPRTVRIPPEYAGLAPSPLKNGFMPSRAPATSMARWPRSAIIVDEWGPYDWRSPKLWPVDSSHGSPLRLRVLGPRGRWRVVSERGIAAVIPTSGRVPDTILVTSKPDSAGDWDLTLEYVGVATVSPHGERRPARTPYRFSYSRFEPRIDWRVRFYRWGDSTRNLRKEPASPVGFSTSTPIISLNASRLDFEGYRALRAEVPREFFALEATGSVDLAPGEYTLRTLSDDGVRVWVDGALVIDNWAPHETALNFAELRGGHHEIRVQYYQADGWYELRVDIVGGRDRSPGSPGPHGAD